MKLLTHWRTVRCPHDPARYVAPETLDHFHLKGFVLSPSGRGDILVTTAKVVRVSGRDVWTASGSHYHLGPIAPDFALWLAENGFAIDEAEPVKLITDARGN